jgi:serine phosphatase RsbU (regulator of sigma subunit)
LIESRNNKIVLPLVNEIELTASKLNLGLILLGLILVLIPFYYSINFLALSSILFVSSATYIGFYKYGLAASIWSLIILSFNLSARINFFDLATLIFILLTISLGLGNFLESYDNLINRLKYKNREFKQAKRVHQTFFPNGNLQTTNFSIDVFYQSSERIGGDYYNYIELEDKVIGYLSDVTGHGLDGALLNIFIREKINSFLDQDLHISSKNILKFLVVQFAQEDFPADYSLAIDLWVIDKKTKTIYYNNAGNHIPILVIKGQQVIENIEKNPPICDVFCYRDYNFITNKIELDYKDKVLFLTDGLIEQHNQAGRYGLERLKEVIKENTLDSRTSLLEHIYYDFNKFRAGDLQQDDLTMICIEQITKNK